MSTESQPPLKRPRALVTIGEAAAAPASRAQVELHPQAKQQPQRHQQLQQQQPQQQLQPQKRQQQSQLKQRPLPHIAAPAGPALPPHLARRQQQLATNPIFPMAATSSTFSSLPHSHATVGPQPAPVGLNQPTQVLMPEPQQQHETAKPKAKAYKMSAGGEVWQDPTLADWPDDDFRIFVGDIGNDVTTEVLAAAFSEYASFQKALVVRNKTTKKSKGFGFVSFGSVRDFMAALKEQNGRYIGNRPCKLRKSTWKERLSSSSNTTAGNKGSDRGRSVAASAGSFGARGRGRGSGHSGTQQQGVKRFYDAGSIFE